MKKRPLLFGLQGVLFILLGLSFPLQIILAEDFSPSLYLHSFALLGPLNWATMFAFFILGYLSFSVSPLLKIALPASFSLVTINNLVALDILSEHALENLILRCGPATFAYAVFLYLVMFKSNQSFILENPQLHWWKVPPRYKISFPVWFAQSGRPLLQAHSYDIAQGGVFISFEDEIIPPATFTPGETLQLHMDLFGNVIQCQGELVRFEQSPRGNHPAGLGVKLKLNDFNTSHILKSFLKTAAPATI